MRKDLIYGVLHHWRNGGDLIQTYKNVKGLEWYSGLQFVSDSRTRAARNHSKRLKREVFPSKACNTLLHNWRNEEQ